MSKATVNMTNWELYVYSERYSLSGIADNHPDLGKNTYISGTSSLVDYAFGDDVLMYETRNTIYVCPLKYMSTLPYNNITVEYREKLTHRANAADSILDKIIAATAKLSIPEIQSKSEYSYDELLNHIKELQVQGQKEIAEMVTCENSRLIEVACQYEDCIYIEVSNVGCGNLLAYHFGDLKGTVQPSLHSGMFSNSVLYMKCATKDEPCNLDFRYFPNGWGDSMETYSWSDNIVRAVIKNDTNHQLRFNKVEIPIGATMIFTPDNHKQGLISPGCYNGKH